LPDRVARPSREPRIKRAPLRLTVARASVTCLARLLDVVGTREARVGHRLRFLSKLRWTRQIDGDAGRAPRDLRRMRSAEAQA
jgi:hypothetical protein